MESRIIEATEALRAKNELLTSYIVSLKQDHEKEMSHLTSTLNSLQTELTFLREAATNAPQYLELHKNFLELQS